MKKHGTIALLVRKEGKESSLSEVISDAEEVEFLERISTRSEFSLTEALREFRAFRNDQTERFGDYVESVVANPAVQAAVRDHCLKWLHSKIRMDRFADQEKEAAELIARFAFQVYGVNPETDDFWLDGVSARVRIRVFTFQDEAPQEERETA